MLTSETLLYSVTNLYINILLFKLYILDLFLFQVRDFNTSNYLFQLLAKCAFVILFHFIFYFISALFQLTKTVLIVTFWEKAGNKNSSFNHPNVHASPYDLFCV